MQNANDCGTEKPVIKSVVSSPNEPLKSACNSDRVNTVSESAGEKGVASFSTKKDTLMSSSPTSDRVNTASNIKNLKSNTTAFNHLKSCAC